jgi:hypothetical protein
MRQPIQLMLTGFLQVLFVSINTLFIAKTFYVGIAFAAFAISFIWSINVKKIAFGTTADRLTYAIGAASGSVVGTYLANFILQI